MGIFSYDLLGFFFGWLHFGIFNWKTFTADCWAYKIIKWDDECWCVTVEDSEENDAF